MNDLVFIENGRVVTDSLTVAEMFGKRHDHVLRDIDKQVEKLKEAGEEKFLAPNFGETSYNNSLGRANRKFILTEEAFALVTMAYVTVEAMRFKVKFINEFNRMKEQLNKKTPSELIALLAQNNVEQEKRLSAVEEKVGEVDKKLNERMTLDYYQQSSLLNAKNKRVEKLWNAEGEYLGACDTRKKLHAAAWRDVRRAFGVASYKDVRQTHFEEALHYVEAWRPAIV